MNDTPVWLTRELQARCEAAVEEAIYNFLYGDDMDTARPKQFQEHFVNAILPLIESELSALRTRCEQVERELADVKAQLTQESRDQRINQLVERFLRDETRRSPSKRHNLIVVG